MIWKASPALLFLTVACLILGSCAPSDQLLEDSGSFPRWLIGPLIVVASFSSEDLTCVSAGILSSRGVITFWYASFWCWLGILVGDVGLYLLGRLLGERVAQVPLLRRFLTPDRLHRGGKMFEVHGGWMLLTTRFIPGSRLPAYTGAGLVKYSLPKFTFYLSVAGLLWTPAIVGMAHWWGETVVEWLDVYERYAWLAAGLAALLAWFTIQLLIPFFSMRGRRLLLSRYHRLLEWEFWPPLPFYAPLLPYGAWLAAKHGHPTAFTAANPGIEYGGMVQESKSKILQGLSQRPENEAYLARWSLLPPGEGEERLRLLEEFQGTLEQPYPIVLKPDVGERGQGVSIVRSQEEAKTFLQECREAVIAQEFISGQEFGVFYFRQPGASQGQIFSITEKHLVQVSGDGASTLEHLILHDPRALRMARFFLRQHEHRLDWIPEPGETVTLGELGTHCRGARFTDARDLNTGALTKLIDEISQGFEGFYFGRYDLRVPDTDDLRHGQNLKILELNGVSAEATHIYQPGYPLLLAYRDLAEQWRLAFQIGKANMRLGTPPTPPIQFLRLLWRHLTRRKFESPGASQRHCKASKCNSAGDPSSTPSKFTGSKVS